MAIVGNRYYNDPNIGQAFSNLQSMFAPPSGGDLAGYATAAATKEKAARLAELFAYAKDPNYNKSMADRMGVLGGLYAPNQSYYSVDLGDQTTRRGQDLNASTALKMNSADNDRMLQTNRADNDRLLQANQADNERAAFTARYATPIGANEMLPALPEEAASKWGLPAQPDPLIGIITANQDQTVTTPDGRVIKGATSPLSETQWQAQQNERMRSDGLLTDQMLVDAINGKETPVMVLNDEKVPVYMTPGAATREQRQAYVKASDPSEVTKLQAERDALPLNDPRRREIDQRIQALGRGQQQSAYDKTNDENLAKLNDEISKHAMQSFADKNMLVTIQDAITNPSVDQGAMASSQLMLRKYLNAFGVDAGNTSPAEMVNALGNVLALRLRDPSNGAGMPGALSDSDREFLKSMVVSLDNSPEANRQIVAYYMKMQEKNIDLEMLRRDYIQKNGRLDDGFRAVVTDYLKANDPATQAAAAQQPTAETPGVEVWDYGPDGKLQRMK